MSLQTIKSMDGKIEYVLLPVAAFNALRSEIMEQLKHAKEHQDYELFNPVDFIDNPVALARIEAEITQEELAKLWGVSQAYISKIENQKNVTPKILKKIKLILEKRENK